MSDITLKDVLDCCDTMNVANVVKQFQDTEKLLSEVRKIKELQEKKHDEIAKLNDEQKELLIFYLLSKLSVDDLRCYS